MDQRLRHVIVSVFRPFFMQFNHLFNCLERMWHILKEEADADAGSPHISDISFESATPARCVK